jgi:glycosyltransferase involved in cell wall biosynthesis
VSSPWLTIVTVVKDDLTGFQATLASVMEQDRREVQHVIIDSSTDRSEIRAALAAVESSADYLWVPAAGVYAAMNAGLDRAAGDYVYFLNAGDCLYSLTTVADIRRRLIGNSPTWAFGPVEIHARNGERTVTPAWDYQREVSLGLSRGHFPAHQGTIVKRSVLEQLGGFDTSYRIAGDYAIALQLTQVAKPWQLDFPLACFIEGGVSTVEWKRSLREFHRARTEIWSPTGSAALREKWETLSQFVRMWIARDLLGRGRR